MMRRGSANSDGVLHVGREDLAVAVENVGTGGRDGVLAPDRGVPTWLSGATANSTSRAAMIA